MGARSCFDETFWGSAGEAKSLYLRANLTATKGALFLNSCTVQRFDRFTFWQNGALAVGVYSM